MQELSGGWRVEIDHAREWLCMRLFEPFLNTPVQQLAEQIRCLLDREYSRNLVLEMDQVIRDRQQRRCPQHRQQGQGDGMGQDQSPGASRQLVNRQEKC